MVKNQSTNSQMDSNPAHHRHRIPFAKAKPSGRAGISTNLEPVNCLNRTHSRRSIQPIPGGMPAVRRTRAACKDTNPAAETPREIRQKVLRWGCNLCPNLHFKVRKAGKAFPGDSSLQKHVANKHPDVADWTSVQYKWGRRVYYRGGGSVDIPWSDDEEPDSDLVSDTATSRTATPEPSQGQITPSPSQITHARFPPQQPTSQQGSPLRQEQRLPDPRGSTYAGTAAVVPSAALQRHSYYQPQTTAPYATPGLPQPLATLASQACIPAIRNDPIPPHVRIPLQEYEARDTRTKALFDAIRDGTATLGQQEVGWKYIHHLTNDNEEVRAGPTYARDSQPGGKPEVIEGQAQSSTCLPSNYNDIPADQGRRESSPSKFAVSPSGYVPTIASNDLYARNHLERTIKAGDVRRTGYPGMQQDLTNVSVASSKEQSDKASNMQWRPADVDGLSQVRSGASDFVVDDHFLLQMEYQTLGMRARFGSM